MRKLFLLIVVSIFVFNGIKADSDKVFFMTSAEININQAGYDIGFSISDKNAINLYTATTIDNKIRIKPSNKTELYNTYQDIGVQHVLFYVHGYGKEIEDVYQRALLIQELYDVKVVFFFWPYKTLKGKQSNLFQSQAKIHQSLSIFESYIALAEEMKESNHQMQISLMAHSLGNYFLKLYAIEGMEDQVVIFDNLVLNSAAVNDRKHGEWLSKLKFQKRTYVLYNNHDFLLKGLQVFTRAKRQLGTKTKRFKIPSVTYIDLSEIIGFRRPVRDTHSYFTGEIVQEVHQVKDMYNIILRGDEFGKSNFIALDN